MDLRLGNKQSQKLSPGMQMSLKLLQMGSLELSGFITEAVQENPMLDFSEGPAAEGWSADSIPGEDRRAVLEEWSGSRPPGDRGAAANPLENMAEPDTWRDTLYFSLVEQLRAMQLPKAQLKLALGIAESLNREGYLDEPMEALAGSLRTSLEKLEKVLAVVQSLEPAGVAARSLGECLQLQMRRKGWDSPLAQRITGSYLGAVAKNHYAFLAKELSADIEDVRTVCERIRTLNPKPGNGFSSGEPPLYIIPDLIADWSTGHFELTLNEQFMPRLQLSSYYSRLLCECEEQEVREYLAEKDRMARQLIAGLDQRRTTMLRCARCILQIQEDHFRQGGPLRPMSLRDVAVELELHESTVSRAVRDKYILCGRSVYPLRYFFSRNLYQHPGGGGDLSTDEARTLLKKLIREEDTAHPLSDQKLCSKLEEFNCSISRRTVAKYRDELGIPPAAGRKLYK